jgi:uncharacterized protein involved in outer membrane biogenesis
MKRKNIVFLVILIILVLAFAGLFYLKSYFTQDRVKALLVSELEKKWKGKIAIENLDFSLFRGVELRGIRVEPEGGKEGMGSFQCEQVFLRPRLFPLIFGQLVMGEVRLIRPQIFILGKVEGMAALPALFLKREVGEERKEEKVRGEGRKRLSLMVEDLKVKKGELVLLNPEGYRLLPPVLQLEEIELSASHLSLSSPIPFTFSSRLKGVESEPLRIEGVINPREKAEDLNILWEKLQLKSFNKALPTIHPLLSQGEVDLELHLNIHGASPVLSKGRIKIIQGRFAQKESPEKKGKGHEEDFDAEVSYQLTWDQRKEVYGKVEKGRFVYRGLDMNEFEGNFSWKEKTLNLTEVKGRLGEGFIQGKAEIGLGKEGTKFSLSLKGQSLPLNNLLSLSASDLKKNLSGSLSGEAELKGMLGIKGLEREELQGNVKIRLQQGRVTGVKVLEQLSATLGYGGLSPLIISEGKMDLQVEEGKVKTEGWIKTSDLEVSYRGNVKLDSSLNLLFELKCSPRIFPKFTGLRIADLLRDENGWLVIPLKLKGTLDDPSLRLHSSELKKRLKDKLKDEFLERLEEEGV